MVSAYSMPEHPESALGAGAVAHITKPIERVVAVSLMGMAEFRLAPGWSREAHFKSAAPSMRAAAGRGRPQPDRQGLDVIGRGIHEPEARPDPAIRRGCRMCARWSVGSECRR